MAKTSSKSAASTKGASGRKRTTTPPPAKLDGATVLETASAPIASVSELKIPTHEDIAFRAWELYQMRASSEGGALNDWLAAERELRAS